MGAVPPVAPVGIERSVQVQPVAGELAGELAVVQIDDAAPPLVRVHTPAPGLARAHVHAPVQGDDEIPARGDTWVAAPGDDKKPVPARVRIPALTWVRTPAQARARRPVRVVAQADAVGFLEAAGSTQQLAVARVDDASPAQARADDETRALARAGDRMSAQAGDDIAIWVPAATCTLAPVPAWVHTPLVAQAGDEVAAQVQMEGCEWAGIHVGEMAQAQVGAQIPEQVQTAVQASAWTRPDSESPASAPVQQPAPPAQ